MLVLYVVALGIGGTLLAASMIMGGKDVDHDVDHHLDLDVDVDVDVDADVDADADADHEVDVHGALDVILAWLAEK